MPFESIVGHRRLIALISRAIAQQTLPPAMLLAGPEGVGKRRVALAIAEALNCLQPIARAAADGAAAGVDACGRCSACRRIARGIHPDVLTIEPLEKGNILVEQVRDPIERSGYKPFEGRCRVVIIDEADAMLEPAQNALLKTLEEPPSTSVFLLVSAIPDSLLPTVLSRCVRLRFGPLAAGEIAEALIRDHRYAEPDARAAAADAGGSLGRALAAESADLIAARESAQHLLQAARTADLSRRIDAAKRITAKKDTPAAERATLAACLRVAASLLRDSSILASRGDARLLANADLEDVVRGLAGVYGGDRATKAYGTITEALEALERYNSSPKLVADWVALRL